MPTPAYPDLGAFFHSVAETSRDCIRVLSVDGVLEYMNARGQALFEIERFEENQSRIWAELWPDESQDLLRDAVKRAAAGEVARFRAHCPTAKGAARWWDTDVCPIRNAQGEIIRLVATSRDVTADVETASFMDTVLQLLPALLLVKNARDGRYVLANKAAEDVLGIPAQDLIGKSVFDLFPAAEAEKFAREDREVVDSRTLSIEQDEQITTKSRGRRYFSTKKMATYGDDGPQHIVTIAEDVTERHEASEALKIALAQAEQANASKSAFLANMSHEIRTPLNGIVAVADVLSRAGLDPKHSELVDLICTSSETLERLLSDILDLARIEAGQISIEAGSFDLGSTVRSIANLFKMRADEKGVALTTTVAPDVEGMVAGDLVRVRQVLTNLLSNAVKFTDQGEVALMAERIAGDLVRFTVRDTGVGFNSGDTERVFSRFQQADTSITRRFGGTGLGLTISRELADLMGGTLNCESSPGRGSTFWFEVPLARQGKVIDLCAQHDQQSWEPLRVLVADDHPTNRKVVELLLADYAEVVCVENGREAVDAAFSSRFDVILMDMQMPVMDGLTAVREIRRREPEHARVPILMLTANALPEHVAASHQAGADGHLNKPITASALLEAIDTIVHPLPEVSASAA
jgi:PAS domain S-box-containing protein